MQSSNPLQIPPSNKCIRVKAIDTTTRMVCHAKSFLQPTMENHSRLNFLTMCFLLERDTPDGVRYTLYDCGSRKDYWNGSPLSKQMIGTHVPGLEIDQGVEEVLVEAGVDLSKLDAIIWSHWHWDHIGDVSKFPTSADLVVGPGFVDNFTPGWPENPECPILASDLAGRELRELDFLLNIGGFPAHDYFGDGSFYLLDVPGHAIGHICGLARTTPSTFVFLGADCCHFAGAIRPSESMPMPDYPTGQPACPCSLFTSIHPREKDDAQTARSQPFYEVPRTKECAFTSPEEAQNSLNRLQHFDAHPDIFILLAHDNILFDTLPLLNHHHGRDINDWQVRRWKEDTRWEFLKELPVGNDSKERKLLVDGLWRNGREVVYGADGEFHDKDV